jgi:hypothetical protein
MLTLLFLLVLFTRLPQILSYNIPFSFDHGRDSLAVLQLIKTFNPVFIGPWTSIPGLFFGPGWYYLLTPAYWLLGGNPLAGPLTMLVLNLLIVFLAKKFFGRYEAIIFTAAPLFLITSTGAANPFPMILLGLLLIIALEKNWPVFWSGFILGWAFHFSSALAILWLLPLLIIIKPRQWLKFFAGLILTFLPQLLFEIKHNFSQVRAVIDYFTAGESQHITPGKIQIVTNSVFHELSLAIWPNIGALIIIPAFFLWSKIGLLILFPLIGFWFLHYNPWYAYGLAPLAVVLFGKILRRLPKFIAIAYCLLLIITLLIKKPSDLSGNKAMLQSKLAALNYIYYRADRQPFSSYHYLPEIYDYAYQYLYIWQAFKGRPLPVDFSYQPNAPVYIPEKASLLAKLPPPIGQPEKIFLIIEQPDNIWHYPFESWLKQIGYSEIIDKKIIGPELEVWQLKP